MIHYANFHTIIRQFFFTFCDTVAEIYRHVYPVYFTSLGIYLLSLLIIIILMNNITKDHDTYLNDKNILSTEITLLIMFVIQTFCYITIILIANSYPQNCKSSYNLPSTYTLFALNIVIMISSQVYILSRRIFNKKDAIDEMAANHNKSTNNNNNIALEDKKKTN